MNIQSLEIESAFNAERVAKRAARRWALIDQPHPLNGCVGFDRIAAEGDIRVAGYSAENTALALRWLDIVCAVQL